MPLRLGRFLALLYSLSDMATNIFYLPLNCRVSGSPTGLLLVVSKYQLRWQFGGALREVFEANAHPDHPAQKPLLDGSGSTSWPVFHPAGRARGIALTGGDAVSYLLALHRERLCFHGFL
jgi:hypothetical protein